MKWFAVTGMLSAILAGCVQSSPPPAAPPPPAPVAPAPVPAKPGVEVHAPGVDVNVGKGGVGVNAPGADVEVDRKK